MAATAQLNTNTISFRGAEYIKCHGIISVNCISNWEIFSVE